MFSHQEGHRQDPALFSCLPPKWHLAICSFPPSPGSPFWPLSDHPTSPLPFPSSVSSVVTQQGDRKHRRFCCQWQGLQRDRLLLAAWRCAGYGGYRSKIIFFWCSVAGMEQQLLVLPQCIRASACACLLLPLLLGKCP